MGMTRLMARASATDRLSALSDDVLLDHIFTKISYTDVIRSSILSQRWRFLWRKTPILKFCRQDFEKQKDDRILAIINNALLHLDARLLYFNLRIALDDPKAADINTWIRLAAEKKVERMELHISYRDPNRTLNASTIVELGETVFRCENLTALVLKSINLPMIPNNFGVFRSLKKLYCWGNLNLDDAMFEQFMAVCPHLRNLGIGGCRGLRNLIIRSSNLMYLQLTVLSPGLSLQIACPRLTEISLIDWGPCSGLKLLQGISRSESIKRIIIHSML
ncbi:F-box/FBD/LRR-repeat protein At5g56420-like [Cryptomeria japonica]|uniref:F-box/FBD/LRR-repeat protein At5g56420-like n=1 Tax=Cryptomeria japonica TaxID=3369 RepID=UPI0025AD4EFD|nr:F-box/FBD/LRR-repeat protein At5g56420-like [Cryptomeria japonica]